MDYPKSVPGVGLVNGKFVDEDQTAGTPGSLIPATWGNGVTDEVVAVQKLAGLDADEAKSGQMAEAVVAVARNRTGVTMVLDTGAANACVVGYVPVITALVDNQILGFKVKATNTGASTIKIDGVAAKPIVGMGLLPLTGGELVAGGMATAVYRAGIDKCVLLSCIGGAAQLAAGAYGVAPAIADSSAKLATTSWIRSAMADIATAAGFAWAGTAASGYVKLPTWLGGFIFQWLQGSGSNTFTLNFPTIFPNGCMGIVATDTGASRNSYGAAAISNSQCNIYGTSAGWAVNAYMWGR